MPILGSFGAAAARGFGLSGGKGPVVVDYVIQGGGGGGGFYVGAGGGAGGYVAGTSLELARGTPFTVTVGAPGPANGGPQPYHQGGDGGDSGFTGLTTAVGGGAGGGGYGGGGGRGGFPGMPGGSGGGGGGQNVPPQTGGTGTTNQGNPGGPGGTPGGIGGGGGGANNAGSTTSAGAGTPNSITGSEIYFAVGGNSNAGPGGQRPPGQGGMPQGPYSPPWDDQSADLSYFGGRGVGGRPDKYAGASGGVIIRGLTADLSTATYPGPATTVTTDGDYTVIRFTASTTFTP